MRPFQTSVLLVLALLTTASALAAVFVHRRHDLASFLSSQSGTDMREPTRTAASVSRKLSSVGDEKRNREPSIPSVPTFDALQISPDGTSVFAGRAPPRSHVTVLADQRPIATATANENGEWLAVINEKIGTGDHQFSLTARLQQDGPLIYGQIVQRTVAASSLNTPLADSGRSVSSVTLPRPITFIYNEAAFTTEGRRAAELLADYLRSRQQQTVTLSGHADERGSDRYNMELSQERLDAVARYLREKGVAAKFVLVPKGRSEPFIGVDRRCSHERLSSNSIAAWRCAHCLSGFALHSSPVGSSAWHYPWTPELSLSPFTRQGS
jgi:outer membrane protein OmpA-like peptidoglycan-associated protein